MPENFWRPASLARKFLGTTTMEFKSTNYQQIILLSLLFPHVYYHHLPSIHEQDGYSVFTILRTNISLVSEDRPSCMMAFISSRTSYGITLDTENLGHTHIVTTTGPKYIWVVQFKLARNDIASFRMAELDLKGYRYSGLSQSGDPWNFTLSPFEETGPMWNIVVY